MIVYCATNIINGKQYIGYTSKGLEVRKAVHIRSAYNPNDSHYFHIFKCALRKYGTDNFEWKILKEYEVLEDCLLGEILFIKKYNTISPNGYNLTEGGTGGVQSEEVRAKISNSLKEYYKQNLWTNKLTTEERIEIGKRGAETKRKNGYKAIGHPHTNLSKTKMSDTKNVKNQLRWKNVITNEEISLSCTKMAEYTGLTIGMFSHLKIGRAKQTSCGWKYLK